jgi:hypothetical protein
MEQVPGVKKQKVTRRNLLKAGAAGVLGTAAATALTATPASADDGDPIILGRDNFAFSPTQIQLADTQERMEVFPTRGEEILYVETAYIGTGIRVFSHGTAMEGSASGHGVKGSGYHGDGVIGRSNEAVGVRGWSELGTGIKAEAKEIFSEGAIAFEAAGPVKFSTSGLAAVPSSTNRANVDPGVPITSQSKVLATLQGNSGNGSLVEHVEISATTHSFTIVLTKPPARTVQIAWFLIS